MNRPDVLWLNGTITLDGTDVAVISAADGPVEIDMNMDSVSASGSRGVDIFTDGVKRNVQIVVTGAFWDMRMLDKLEGMRREGGTLDDGATASMNYRLNSEASSLQRPYHELLITGYKKGTSKVVGQVTKVVITADPSSSNCGFQIDDNETITLSGTTDEAADTETLLAAINAQASGVTATYVDEGDHSLGIYLTHSTSAFTLTITTNGSGLLATQELIGAASSRPYKMEIWASRAQLTGALQIGMSKSEHTKVKLTFKLHANEDPATDWFGINDEEQQS